MLKVPYKINAFRSFEGTRAHTRLRSFSMTCDKHGVNKFQAISQLFECIHHDFVDDLKERLVNE
jgi:hypothetical protein